MAIEVDYFAWETWRPTKGLWGSYVHKNAEKFGFDSYIRNAVYVASVESRTEDLVPACYIFLAESQNLPITKLLCISWFYLHGTTNLRYIDEIDVDEETAEAFHQDFLALPAPIPVSIDSFPGRPFYFHHLDLGHLYGDISYIRGSDFSRFHFANSAIRKAFDDHFDRILNRCQSLTAHRFTGTEQIKHAIEVYEVIFRSKAKYMKYQGRWPKPIVLEAYERESFWREKPILESFRTVDMSLWGNLIDFKHYLPRFLKFMAFERLFDIQFSAEHEAILFTKLREADLHNWDEDEQAAISIYFEALFKNSLSYYPSIRIASSNLLLWLIRLGFNLEPHLSYWESNLVHVDSLRHLGAFLKSLIEENLSDSLPETLSKWLNQANIEKALENAIASYEGKRPYAHEFVEALENLRLIRA